MVDRIRWSNVSQFREEGFCMILGTISAIDDDNGLQLIIDGEDTPTTKKYTYMSSYVPTANDRVLIEEISGSYVIMGKVISDVASSGIARQATTAASCTGNAATATTAESCTGNAATATKADSATQADSLKNTNTNSGYLVYSVDRTYNSQLGTYIVTDVRFSGWQQNYIYKT